MVQYQSEKAGEENEERICEAQKSKKWSFLNAAYMEKSEEEKAKYYENIVEDLKLSNPSQWYSKLKRMSSHDQAKSEEPIVQSFDGMSDAAQSEEIANQFSQISNLYKPLQSDDICLDGISNNKPYPNMEPFFVHKKIKGMKNNTSTVIGDIPVKVIKLFGYELSFPLSNIFKRSCQYGE